MSWILSFISSNSYTRMYDLDVLDEIENDKIAKKIIGISNSKLDRDYELIFEEDGLDDVYLSLVYIIVAQMIALITSLRVGNTPDNPSRTHTVNRVVKGVTIHDYK